MLLRHGRKSLEEVNVSASSSDSHLKEGANTPASSIVHVEDGDDGPGKPTGVSKRRKLSGLTKETKEKAKRLFKSKNPGEDDIPIGELNIEDELKNDPAFNQGQLAQRRRRNSKDAAEGALSALQTVGRSIVHPKEIIKSKATKTTAGQLSKAQRPYLSQKADLEFLQAHDNLRRAESISSSLGSSSEEDHTTSVGHHRDRVRQLESHRESLLAAWTTSRHVQRVRVVPKRHINFPEDRFFHLENQDDNSIRYDWLKWLGYNLIYYTQDFCAQYIDDFDQLPFDIDSSRHYLERLLTASAPWQSWLVKVRAVYRWENPKLTGKWLALYLVLWYTQHIMGFLYAYIVYMVVRNWYAPTHIESIRDSAQRAFESKAKATKFVELIDKHGGHDWLEPVIDEVGPYVQLQLGDLANLLEVMLNFYHWKSPRKTFASICFFASCLLVTLFADMEFCMKIVWFVAGGTFFFCWPVSSQYPKYRYLVSPFKWVLWDIPTHSEWSFQYLRRQAQIAREDLIKQKVQEAHAAEVNNPAVNEYSGGLKSIPQLKVANDEPDPFDEESSDDDWHSVSSTTSVLEGSDIRTFRGLCHGSVGRLTIYSDGIRFVNSVSKAEEWRVAFVELVELRKSEGSRAAKLLSRPERLEIRTTKGIETIVDGMKDRDDAFNTIIGFSGLQWQSLQIKRDDTENKT